jgi:hypothetical protein
VNIDFKLKWYTELVVSSLRESALFAAGSAAVAVAGAFAIGIPFPDGLGFVLLVVSAGLMLVGGALSFVSPGNVRVIRALTNAKIDPDVETYRKTREKAALYSVTGVFLLVYSLALASVFA